MPEKNLRTVDIYKIAEWFRSVIIRAKGNGELSVKDRMHNFLDRCCDAV